MKRVLITVCLLIVWPAALGAGEGNAMSSRLTYNHPGVVVDLGVGLWPQPLPMDYDGDGDNDLLVATADVPSNGIYFFENPGGAKYPVFKPGVRLDNGVRNTTISYVDGTVHVMTPGKRYPNFTRSFFADPVSIPHEPSFYAGRADQWKLCDYDGDGLVDLIVGVSDWREYGWDDAYNEKGEWTRGPLHGYVYFVRNIGTNETPVYGDSVRIQAGGKPLDVYGCPSPNFADWDGDGDLDLVCGEFLDKMTYFENIGTRTEPRYAPGRFLSHDGEIIKMDLQMIQVVAFDWDKDGDTDLVVGQEDGRVALVENTGELVDGMPAFVPPRFFQQEADAVKIGALCTPYSFDWDGDGDEDLIAGDTAGYINFVENLDGGDPPRWAPPVYLKAGGEIIRIQAGPNGSIQGPCEAKWGYTVPNVADWNHDGLPDIVINSIWGEVLWYENVGTRTAPELTVAEPIEVAWNGPPPKPEWLWWEPKGNQLVTQWRTTPWVIDLNRDGLNDLVMLDREGYLAFFERRMMDGKARLLPGKRIFLDEEGEPLRLNPNRAGKSGRRKFAMTDWDGDGKLDVLINSRNIDFMRNVAEDGGGYMFKNLGPLDQRRLAGHSTCPAIVDWDRNGIPDLLIGAEDGFLYYLENPRR
jgi:hypothetical protein